MNHAEQPDVIRARMLDVIRTLQRLPNGVERKVLETYRNQLAAIGRTIEPPSAPSIRQRVPNLMRSPRPLAPSIEL
jgi:hypothetical protein